MITPFLIALIVAAVGAPAPAQQASEDWDLGRDAERNLVIAAVTFETFGIAVRCRDNVLSVVASGVPVAEGSRIFKYSMGGEPERNTTWVGTRRSQTAFAIWPASVASDLRQGGRLSLGVPDGDHIKRITVDLPPSPSAIGQVFAACGRELPDDDHAEPDQENLGALVWRQRPQPSFPSRTNADAGLAALLCNVDARGRLRRCKVESEFPEGGGFGRAATLGAHQTGRVGIPSGQTGLLDGRQISLVVRYNIIDAPLPVTPSRLPDRPQ